MNSWPENLDNFRYIVYSAQVLIPSQFPFDSNSKRRKTDPREANQTTQVQPKGLAHWIDQFTEWQFAVVNLEPEKTQQHFGWCDDISFEHQHILVYTNDNPKHMEKITKSYIRHESKILFEIKARIFAPTSAFQTFNQQFLRLNVSDITRRGEIFDQFTRNADTVMDISPKRCSTMETVWEIGRSRPNRRIEPAGMTDYQRRILTKIESLESTDSPFKNTLEDYIDILATGWGSIYRTDHSVYLEVQCGMNNAQCTCWECWDAPLEDDWENKVRKEEVAVSNESSNKQRKTDKRNFDRKHHFLHSVNQLVAAN